MPNILIIDDDETICFTLESFLEDDGFNIYTTPKPKLGIKIAAEEDIHIAIVDLNIPEMSGVELIKLISNVKPNIKFIIHTGENGYIIPLELVNLGITQNNILYKPIFDMNILTITINNLLNNYKYN